MKVKELVVFSGELNVALATGKVFEHASVTHDRARMTTLQLHVAHTPATAILEFLEIQWNRNLRERRRPEMKYLFIQRNAMNSYT